MLIVVSSYLVWRDIVIAAIIPARENTVLVADREITPTMILNGDLELGRVLSPGFGDSRPTHWFAPRPTLPDSSPEPSWVERLASHSALAAAQRA